MSRTIDGTTAGAAAIPPTYQVFTSGSGTYTPPAGVSYLIVEMCGGGGGGGKNSSTYAAGGGSGAGYIKAKFPVGTYSYSVGAGGAGQGTAGSPGGNGGNTTFSTLMAEKGYGGPTFSNSEPAVGGGSNPTGAILVLAAVQGGYGSVGSNLTCSPGGGSFWAPPTYASSGSLLTTSPSSYGYGGGGSGVTSNNFSGAAGNGSSGRIIVTEYY